jgi:hypothetical protein
LELDDDENEYEGGMLWLSCKVEVYETTDSSLLIIHGRDDYDISIGGDSEVRHHFAICPGPKALSTLYFDKSPLESGARLHQQSLHISTAHFKVITPNLTHRIAHSSSSIYDNSENFKPEISIMEIPELGAGSISCSTPTTVAIGIYQGGQTYFIHVRLGLLDTKREGWTTYNEHHKPKEIPPEQPQFFVGSKKQALSFLNSSEGDTLWRTREDLEEIHGFYFKESIVMGNGSTITLDSSTEAVTSTLPSPQQQEQQSPRGGLHIAVRMPATKLDFDHVLSAFLPQYNLSTSSIDDYYIQKLTDTGYFVSIQEGVLTSLSPNHYNSFKSHFFEIPCISPYLPNEPGLLFAIVVKFHDAGINRQLIEGRNDLETIADGSGVDALNLFQTGVVALFVHTSAVSGVSHIVAELSWPEFRDPANADSKNNSSPPLLQVLQEELTVPSSFENSIMILSNSQMILQQRSMQALHHPILPQWLIGSTQSIDGFQRRARLARERGFL